MFKSSETFDPALESHLVWQHLAASGLTDLAQVMEGERGSVQSWRRLLR